MAAPQNLDYLRRLFVTGEFSDMKVICEDVTFDVHRAIVCAQSGFFRAAFSHNFKESAEQTITIKEDRADTIERVLRYLYLRTYDESGHVLQLPFASLAQNEHRSSEERQRAIALAHIRVFFTADKFGIDDLKHFAVSRFTEWAESHWDSPVFPEIAKDALTMVPPYEASHRTIIARVLTQHVREMTENAAMMQVIQSSAILGSEVILDLVQQERVRKINELQILDDSKARINSSHSCPACRVDFTVGLVDGEYRILRVHNGRCWHENYHGAL